VDPDGVSPEPRSDIEELNRRRADIAVGWATVEARNKRRNQVYGPVGIGTSLGLIVAVTAAGIVPVILSLHGMLAERTLHWLVPVGMFGTMAVGAGLYIWWYVASGRPGRTARTEPSGPLDAAAVKEALADTDREARRLRLAQNALPRLEYLRATSQATGRTNVLIAALFIGPFIVGLELLAYFAGTATRLYSWETMLLLWPVPAVITGSYVLWHRRPRRRRQAVEQGLARLAVYLDGRLLPSLADTVGWLNRYWAAPSKPDDYHTGPLQCGAAGTVLGYPVMVDFEPYGRSDDMASYPPRTVIYLAGMPADEPAAVPSDRAGQLRSAISGAGFTVDIDPDAGLTARATPPTVQRFRASPAELGDLGPLIGDLAILAAAEGIAPAPEASLVRPLSAGQLLSTGRADATCVIMMVG
jgi:hypothetical protein